MTIPKWTHAWNKPKLSLDEHQRRLPLTTLWNGKKNLCSKLQNRTLTRTMAQKTHTNGPLHFDMVIVGEKYPNGTHHSILRTKFATIVGDEWMLNVVTLVATGFVTWHASAKSQPQRQWGRPWIITTMQLLNPVATVSGRSMFFVSCWTNCAQWSTNSPMVTCAWWLVATEVELATDDRKLWKCYNVLGIIEDFWNFADWCNLLNGCNLRLTICGFWCSLWFACCANVESGDLVKIVELNGVDFRVRSESGQTWLLRMFHLGPMTKQWPLTHWLGDT